VFACICRAVTCDQVTAAIDDGAATLKAVAKATRACTSCGTCRDRIVNMLAERKPACVLETAPAALATVQAGMTSAAIAATVSAEALSAGALASQGMGSQALGSQSLNVHSLRAA
jgi:bacterioferritin-associated ferredoxin